MKKIATAALAAMMALPTLAQSDDFGLNTTIGVTKKFNKQWSINLEAENRLQDNLKAEDRWTVSLSTAYKPTKWLKLDAGYKFMRNHTLSETKAKAKYSDDGDITSLRFYTYDSYWTTRHRFYASATFSHKFGDLDFSLRERWQYTYRPSTETTRSGTKYDVSDDESEVISNETDEVKGKGSHVLRSRLQVQYDKKRCPWQPYASVELYNGDSSFGIQKMRYTAGLEYKFNKQHSVDIFYRYQRVKKEDSGKSLLSSSVLDGADFDDTTFNTSLFGNNDRNSHIIGIGYTYKF